MVKKLFLSTLIVIGIMYGAGYDFHWIKHSIVTVADTGASDMTGNVNPHGNWGN